MTDDIVTRLRESAEFWSGTEYGADFAKCAEAADEIERLRTVIKKANICMGCDSAWRDEAHIHGKTKCCPDCSHEYEQAVRGEGRSDG